MDMATDALNSGEYKTVTINGHDCIQLPDGRIIRAIAGGRDPDPRNRQERYRDERYREERNQPPARTSQRNSAPPTDDYDADDDGTDEAPEDRQGRSYTQEEFDRHMAGMRRKHQAEMDEMRSEMQQLSGGFNELIEALSEAVGDEDAEGEEGEYDQAEEDQEDDAPPPTRARRGDQNEEVAYLQSQMRKMQKNMEIMQKRLEEEQQAREEELIMRLETERDAQIAKVLQENKAVSVEGGLKYFRDMMEYDPDKEKWVFIEPETGAKLDIGEGIRDSMPDWLKESTAKRGGSGGRGSQQAQLLAQRQNKLTELETAARKDPSPANIAAYQNYKKQLAAEGGQQQTRQGGMGPQVRGPQPETADVGE